MKIIVLYEIDLKDEDLCLGCPYSKIKEEGKNYTGGCDCSSEDRCSCLRISSYRNKDKDLWECVAYRKKLNTGQIPKRCKKCKERGQLKDLSPEVVKLDKDKAKLEKKLKILEKKYKKIEEHNKRYEVVLTTLPDLEDWKKLMNSTYGSSWLSI